MSKKYLITTDYGLEDIATAEIAQKLDATAIEAYYNFPQRISFYSKNSTTELLSLRSVHSVLEIIHEFEALDTPTLFSGLEATCIEVLEKAGVRFRVRCERYGFHPFRSVDLERIYGAMLLQKYPQLKVNLTNYDYEVRIDVLGTRVLVSLQLNKEALSRRFVRVHNHRAATKPTIAFALLQLANIQVGNRVLDPTCGSGTIPIEAAHIWGNSIEIIGHDLQLENVEGALQNATSEGFEGLIQFAQVDARTLDTSLSKPVDRIIANLPFGVQSGKNISLKALYETFLLSAHGVLSADGRIVLMTMRGGVLRDVLFRIKMFKICAERITEGGGLFLHVFVLEKITHFEGC
ncbi:MAG: methyltransferase domain-containing protein [Bernardetiaceae bacterium]|nr:methyltransferase domain-containing protein [Bernardetiaceae bacterium]